MERGSSKSHNILYKYVLRLLKEHFMKQAGQQPFENCSHSLSTFIWSRGLGCIRLYQVAEAIHPLTQSCFLRPDMKSVHAVPQYSVSNHKNLQVSFQSGTVKWPLLDPLDSDWLDRFCLAVSGFTLCTAEWI